MVYLDTSVIVAYYCPETFSRQVQDLLREQIKPALSLLTEVEFASAVAKKVRSNELSSVDGNRILAMLISRGFFCVGCISLVRRCLSFPLSEELIALPVSKA